MSGASTPVSLDTITRSDESVVKIVFVEQESDRYVMDVLFDLDPDAETERPLTRYDAARACVRSCVELDLKGDHHLLTEHFTETYRDTDFSSLCEKPQEGSVAPLIARRALWDIARSGASVFDRLFRNQTFQEPVEGPSGEVERAVLSALRRASAIYIDCRRCGPLFPWALVYDSEALDELRGPKALDVQRFWGMSHVLQVEYEHTARLCPLPAPLSVGSALCPVVLSAPTAVEDADPFESWSTRRKLPNVEALRGALATMSEGALYALVHASHAAEPSPATSQLFFDNNPISVAQLQRAVSAARAESPALVFLNACKTSVLERWSDNTMPGFLLRRHSRRLCYVGTTAEVPRPLAVAFARDLWAKVLIGVPVGRALRDTRRELFARSGNPLGLLYCLYGKAMTHVPPRRSPP